MDELTEIIGQLGDIEARLLRMGTEPGRAVDGAMLLEIQAAGLVAGAKAMVDEAIKRGG